MKFLTTLMFIFLLFCFASVIYLDVALLSTRDVIIFNNGDEFPLVQKDPYKPGQRVPYRVDSTQLTTGVKVTVSWRIDCGKFAIALPNTGYETLAGRTQYINDSIVLPADMPKGICKITTLSDYQINPFKSILVSHSTQSFSVE